MPKVRVGDINLHYIRAGRGPDVVMLHGLLGNLAVWHLHIVPELRREFRITTYDLRGHGYSDVPPSGYSTDELALELEGLLDRLEIERPCLVGHSYGADVALNLAWLRPERVRALVAIDPALPAFVDQRRSPDWVGWDVWAAKLEQAGISVPPERRTDLPYLIERTIEAPKFFGPARGFPRRREPLLHLLRNTALMTDYEKVDSLTLDNIRRITTPTLLVSGEQSQFLHTHTFLSGALENCTSRLMPGGEHFGPLEQPGYLATEMRAFFRRLEGRLGHAPPEPGTGDTARGRSNAGDEKGTVCELAS